MYRETFWKFSFFVFFLPRPGKKFWFLANLLVFFAQASRKIERVQERALRLLLNNYESDYESLLEISRKSKVFTRIHRILAKEVYKTLNNCNPGYMKTIFQKTLRNNPRRPNNLRVQGFRGITYGKNSLRTLGTQIWNNLPEDFKSASSLSMFENLI